MLKTPDLGFQGKVAVAEGWQWSSGRVAVCEAAEIQVMRRIYVPGLWQLLGDSQPQFQAVHVRPCPLLEPLVTLPLGLRFNSTLKEHGLLLRSSNHIIYFIPIMC